MNILFLASSADFHIDLWSKYFSAKHNVYLFSDKEDYLDDQPYDGVRILFSNGYLGRILNGINSDSHFLFQLNKLISVFYFAKLIDQYIDKYDIDIIHAHNLYQGFLVSFIKSKIPVIFTPMGSDIIIHAQKNKIYRYMAKRAMLRANAVTYDSLLLKKKGAYVGAQQNESFIIQNGVISSVFFPKENNLRQDIGVGDDEIFLFSPRGLDHLYNIDIILKAIQQIKQSGYKIKCMFSYAFGGKNLEALQMLASDLNIEENVIWVGRLKYEDMADYYNASDIVVSIPSSDSSPKTVYEAMFCAKPIVVSDLEWSHEFLSDADCFLRLEDLTADCLSKTVIKMARDKILLDNLSSNALKYAHKYYDYEKNMMKMEEILSKTIKKYGSS